MYQLNDWLTQVYNVGSAWMKNLLLQTDRRQMDRQTDHAEVAVADYLLLRPVVAPVSVGLHCH